ncbi:YlzJ-like family protein [Alicyclobacillus sp.]|uniref:YlzJ-like family protein n=1 Tax=Alicyclobacillus sp. TaxID=61169 RepID=UPI0025B8D83E|nr:YlzJ-like family protein [Alicyclobacillus sp.]MCL6516224.1 YlzJ-like family protein [Alicyclobacillus sp.]
MSTLWTIVPPEVLFAASGGAVETEEIEIGGARMVVTPLGRGQARVERLISPDPQHYLRPDWQPGAVIPYPPRG